MIISTKRRFIRGCNFDSKQLAAVHTIRSYACATVSINSPFEWEEIKIIPTGYCRFGIFDD